MIVTTFAQLNVQLWDTETELDLMPVLVSTIEPSIHKMSKRLAMPRTCAYQQYQLDKPFVDTSFISSTKSWGAWHQATSG
jgi:hypothetical protein